jgi:hypothetical protein
MKTLETRYATTVQPLPLACTRVMEKRAVATTRRLCAGWSYENLAEREGFEPSVQVLARTTV